ncbi:MAG: hypothetical protein MZV49_25585 [Rhodopseudomonas palustris]|nr:hypothetical protein [Rhodopseudomonas palustris]
MCVFLEGNPHHTELRAEDLRQAAHALGLRLTGHIDVQGLLGESFGRLHWKMIGDRLRSSRPVYFTVVT